MLSEPVQDDSDELVKPAFHLASPFKLLLVTGSNVKGSPSNAHDIVTPVKKVPTKVKVATLATAPAEVTPENNVLYARISFHIHKYLFTEKDNFLPKLQ